MQRVVTHATGVCYCLSEINSDIYTFLILHTLARTLYIYVSTDVRIRGYFSKPKRVRERRNLGNTALQTYVGIPGIVVLVQTRCGLDGPGFDLLVGARDFVLSTPVHTDPTSHPLSSTLGTGALSLW